MKKTTLLITMLLVGQSFVFAQNTKATDNGFKTDLTSINISNSIANTVPEASKNSESNVVKDDLDGIQLSSKVFDQDVFSMYPNPVRNTLYVTTNTQNSTIEIYNVTGKLLFKKSLGLGKTPISVSDLKVGVYLVKFSSEANTITKKLIVN